MGKRPRMATAETWQQLELLIDYPEQRTYELIRPVVLFGEPLTTRAKETSTPLYVLRRLTERFDAQGMHSLFAQAPAAASHRLPPELHQLIIELKVEHPPLRVHEIATICYTRTGRCPTRKPSSASWP